MDEACSQSPIKKSLENLKGFPVKITVVTINVKTFYHCGRLLIYVYILDSNLSKACLANECQWQWNSEVVRGREGGR